MQNITDNFAVLIQGDYNHSVPLSKEAFQDLLWWIHHLLCVNGQPIQLQLPSVTIFLDASLLGWGATLGGAGIEGSWTI